MPKPPKIVCAEPARHLIAKLAGEYMVGNVRISDITCRACLQAIVDCGKAAALKLRTLPIV